MSKRLLFLFFSLVLVLSSARVYADQGPDNGIANDATHTEVQAPETGPFYLGQGEGGWYGYKVAPKKPKGKKKKAVELAEQKKRYPKLSDFTEAQLWNMYPDDFNRLQQRFLKESVQNPTPQNVLSYMILQNIARKKALAFTNVETMISQEHPELSTQAQYPITTPGKMAMVRMQMKSEDATILNNRDNFALIIFTQAGCSYCKAQESILAYFDKKYQWPVRDIDIHQHPNFAAQFNVTETPTLLLVQRQSGKYMPIAVGVISLSDLENRLYRTIRYMNGKTSPQQWFMYNFEKGTSEDATVKNAD